MLGYEVNEVNLCLSPRTVKRYRRQFFNFGDINPEVIGRPLNSVDVFLVITALYCCKGLE